MLNQTSDIDVVITWVDNSDPEWIEQITKYSSHYDPRRYENLDTLRYVFRSLEEHLNWARKIHLITCGHVPDWLRLDHPKLAIVTHDQILPKECLPTFNSAAIEMGFINIPGLSEKFIYFNDDMFAVAQCNESDFFIKNLPADSIQLRNVYYDGIQSHRMHAMMATFRDSITTKQQHIRENFSKYINIHYGPTQNIFNLMKIITRSLDMFDTQHMPQPHLLTTIRKFHAQHPETVNTTFKNKFRSYNDNGQFAYKFFSFALGNFSPVKFDKSGYYHAIDPQNLHQMLSKQRKQKLICINEGGGFNTKDYPQLKRVVINYLESRLPKKSSFEKNI